MNEQVIRVAVLGASGYTGADFVRLAARHPSIKITALTANSHAGKPMSAVFPHLTTLDLPDLVTWEEVNWENIDAVVCGLPHGTTQDVTKHIFTHHPHIKIIDMSADFRLRDTKTYGEWYGLEHRAKELQPQAVYGLSEHYRNEIKDARLVACPGCYPTATLMALLPVVSDNVISVSDLVIDAKSGVTGAGRGLKQAMLFCEAGEGLSPYAVASHRHAPEIEQEIGKAVSKKDILVNFTPHLIPMSRGELVTIYAALEDGKTVNDARAALSKAYHKEAFIHVANEGILPQTQMVRGSNHCVINVFKDRLPNRIIIIATIDNLVKGSAGQAMQNLNIAFGVEETLGLEQLPLFP